MALLALAAEGKLQPGQARNAQRLQFGLQFTAVHGRSQWTVHESWSSLNQSGRPRPELLMRLGFGSHAGSHPDQQPPVSNFPPAGAKPHWSMQNYAMMGL
jgi:hypothetical protein